MTADIIQFTRTRDYRLIRELGAGACGKTVLLHDDTIGTNFVCKKYSPAHGVDEEGLFQKFVQEVKLLHLTYHQNIVRVFNFYLYPNSNAGYILMEHVDGGNINEYISKKPEALNEVFVQTIRGFRHLEEQGILHRDIRKENILVTTTGIVKIIDLGFSKQILKTDDFKKSITLNWWCATPEEFSSANYDFSTEVYFVGKLFEQLIAQHRISHFAFLPLLKKMCAHSPASRHQSFRDVESEIYNNSDSPNSIKFTEDEKEVYRNFSGNLSYSISSIEKSSGFASNAANIEAHLDEIYRCSMLEEYIPDSASVAKCFISGSFYSTKFDFSVEILHSFLMMFKSCTNEKKNIIIKNLLAKISALPRYDDSFSDIPF